MEKISIIVPIYNSEKSLNRCLDSIINQKYKNLDIVLVDDGSIDNSLYICKQYCDKDSRIQVLTQKNRGVSSARNSGIKASNGEYILFIDSDDYIDDNLIEDAILQLRKENSDIIFWGYTKEIEKNNKQVLHVKNSFTEVGEGVFELFESGLFGYSWNKIFLKKIITDNEIYFLENEDLYEDQYFCCEYIRHVKKISISNDCGYHYVLNENSLSNKKRDNIIILQDKMFNYLELFIKDIKMEGNKSHKLLYKYSLNVYYNYLKNCCEEQNSRQVQMILAEKFKKTDMYKYFNSSNTHTIKLNKREFLLSKIMRVNNTKILLSNLKFLKRINLIK